MEGLFHSRGFPAVSVGFVAACGYRFGIFFGKGSVNQLPTPQLELGPLGPSAKAAQAIMVKQQLLEQNNGGGHPT